jgi:chromosome segregation ATPase
VLPKQGKEVQEIKRVNKSLTQENGQLQSECATWNDRLREVREQITDLTNGSISHLESIERKLNDIKGQVNEFLTSGEFNKPDEYLKELDQELSHLLEYIKLKRQEIDGLQARMSGAEQVLETSAEAAKLFAALQIDLENKENTKN